MAKRTGLTRGDRRRNDRIGALRAVVRPDRAILAIDLGEDKQMAALVDHDGRVLGRRKVTSKAYALGALLGWAGEQAVRHKFAGVVVGCEPTGHRWRSVMDLADSAAMGFVCVQSLGLTLRGDWAVPPGQGPARAPSRSTTTRSWSSTKTLTHMVVRSASQPLRRQAEAFASSCQPCSLVR